MIELKTAITIAEIIIAVLAMMALGDYLSYKFGHGRVAAILGIIALVVIVFFAIYAGIALR